MRILLVSLNYAPEPTGIAPYATGLAEGLQKRGHKVHVVTGIPHYPEWTNYTGVKSMRTSTRVNGVRVTRVRHYVPPGGTGVRRAFLELSYGAGLSLARWGAPEVIIAVSPSLFAAGVAAWATSTYRRVPLVVWVQDLYGRGMSELNDHPGRLAKVASRVESAVLQRADGVVVIHDRFRALATDMGVSPDRVTEIRNWSHVHFEPRAEAAAAMRVSNGWGDRPVVLHCGNMGAKQGLDEVVRTARIAAHRGLDTHFVLMGDGSQRARLKEMARGCPNLEFLPPLPEQEFQAALQAADILLLNEQQGVREMALPSKLTTYFTTGKPVLAAVAPDGTSADEVRAARAGVVVPAGDSGAMLEAVDMLMASPELAAELGRAGQQYAAEKLSVDGVLDSWEGLLTNLLDGRPPVSPVGAQLLRSTRQQEPQRKGVDIVEMLPA